MTKLIAMHLLAFTMVIGCKKSCLKNHINPAFIGFQATDIDTFVLRAYQPNDNYRHLLDTVVIVNAGARIFTTSHDTTIAYMNDSDPDHWVSAGFDWVIFLPAKNRAISISDIVSPQTDNYGRACLNPINSFVQDGQAIVAQQVNTGDLATSGYRAYIHNN